MSEEEDEFDEASKVKTFFHGTLMGLADIVPGVSGGTIALIVGIYERLIFALKSIDLKFIPYLFRSVSDSDYYRRAKRSFSSIDFPFLLPLAAGIGISFLAASKVIPYLRSHYPAYLFSFFFGLIFASAGLVYDRIEEDAPEAFLAGLGGFFFAFFFVGLEGVVLNHSLPIIFVAGFLAICAMLLPGVSGSFIVLFLGQYGYMLEALGNFRFTELGVFLSGSILSLLSFSRLISHLLKKYRPQTLFFLSGLMLGALRLPFRKTVDVSGIPQDLVMMAGSLIAGGVGVIIVFLISRAEEK